MESPKPKKKLSKLESAKNSSNGSGNQSCQHPSIPFKMVWNDPFILSKEFLKGSFQIWNDFERIFIGYIFNLKVGRDISVNFNMIIAKIFKKMNLI